MREKLEMLEKLSSLKVRVVERTGEKIQDILHKSNPWEGIHCGRIGCNFCDSGDEKLVGKCKQRNIVYENECITCKEGGEEEKMIMEKKLDASEREERSNNDAISNENDKTKNEKKRKRRGGEERENQLKKKPPPIYKYIGETSREDTTENVREKEKI